MAALSRSAGSLPADGTTVTADEVVAAVRVHLDRVHDAVRRLGCTPAVAVDVVETSAVELVEVVAATPEAVPDVVGWWFARARERGHAAATTAATTDEAPLGGGLLSVDDDQRRVADALEQLPEQERVALLLRDSYDLPAASVGAAVGLDAAAAMALVARARLALLPLVDGEPAPAVASHVKDLGALARLGEARPVEARDATVRRHALSCAACRAVTDAQQRVHLRLSGLTVVALPDEARARVLARVDRTARRLLPAAAVPGAVPTTSTVPGQGDSRLSPLLVVLSVVLAALAGLGIGLVLAEQEQEREPLAGADGQLPATVPLLSPPASPPPPPASPPTVPEVRPRTTVVVITPPPPSPPPPPPSPSPSPVAPLSLEVSPDSGPNGTQLTVTGTGFLPGSEVTVDYLDAEGQPTGSQAIVEADEVGAFTTELAAQDPANEPGPHEVVATDGETITSALFTAEE